MPEKDASCKGACERKGQQNQLLTHFTRKNRTDHRGGISPKNVKPKRVRSSARDRTMSRRICGSLRQDQPDLECELDQSSLELSILFHTGHRHRVFSVGITLHGWRRIHRPLVDSGRVLVWMTEHLVVSDFLAGVCRHAPHGGNDTGLDSKGHFIVRLVVANRVHQVIPFVDVWAVLGRFDLGLPEHIAACRQLALVNARRTVIVPRLGSNGHSLGTVNMAKVHGERAGIATAIHVEFGTVLKSALDRVRVEILVDPWFAIRAVSIMPSTQSLSLDWPRILHPAEMIDVMDVEFGTVLNSVLDRAGV